MRRLVLIESIAAIVASATIAIASEIPFWVSLAVLLFSWPLAGVVIALLARRSPLYEAPARYSPAFLARGVAFGLVAIVLWWVFGVPAKEAACYSVLGCSAFGALNGILMEWEDTAPGGWLSAEPEDGAK